MTDPAALSAYLDAWFRYVDWPGLYLEVRGLGEKGTPKEGTFRESHLIQPDTEAAVSAVLRHVERWSEHDIGSFIVPSPLLDSVSSHRGGAREQDIALMLGLIVDLDKGDTDAGLRQAERIVGRPTIVVRSGGVTATGHPKRHVYWRFLEPCSEVDLVAGLRKHLALAIGGDPAFGRCTQIIRVPGSVHAKNGDRRPVTIECLNADAEIEVGDVTDAIRALPLPEGTALATTQGVLDFSRNAADRGAIESVLTSDIAEGGQDDRNRWSEFTRTAGWEIHLARTGVVSLSDAADNTRRWMHTHMQPPWPEERFRSEFMGLVNHDIGKHGPFPAPSAAREPLRMDAPGGAPAESLPFLLAGWAVGRTMRGEAPPRRFLIDGLIPYGKPQLWVADGGVGKTWALLQLGMAVASGPGVPWLSSRVGSWLEPGGKCVLLLAEDDLEEIHARLAALDPSGTFRAQYGDNLIVLPLPNMGGAFSIVEMDPARNAQASRKWRELVEQLKQIPDLRLVGIDTYSALLHGEENAAHVAMEWCRVAIEPICGDIGATMVVTHHVRKAGEGTVIRTGRQMRDGIRGATALPNATRSVFGMWPDPDWKQHMKLCGMEPRDGVLFKAGIIKGNNPELRRGEFVLLREQSGELRYHEQASEMKGRVMQSAEKAWLLFAIREAAKAGFPFCKTGRSGLAARRGELPMWLPGQNKVVALADELIADGAIVMSRKNHLDVPDGRFARGNDLPKDGAWVHRPDWNEYEFDDALGEIIPKGATP